MSRSHAISALLVGLALALHPSASFAKDTAQLDQDSRNSLSMLTAEDEVARSLAADANGILVFPKIVKAGFMFGGHVGDGLLYTGGKINGRYNSVAASYGLQAGVQTFGYVLFFMDDESLNHFLEASGFEIGVGPSIVVVEKGMGKSATTTTMQKGIFAMIFDQSGLMAGLGLQGSKITRLD